MKKSVLVVFLIILVTVLLYAVSRSNGVPVNILFRYYITSFTQGKSSLGVSILKCEDSQVITYLYVANNFDENFSILFDSNGKEIKKRSSGDIVDENFPPDLVNIRNCITIKGYDPNIESVTTATSDQVSKMQQDEKLCFSNIDCEIRCAPSSGKTDANSYVSNLYFVRSEKGCTEIGSYPIPNSVSCVNNKCTLKNPKDRLSN